jgi:hypothetical protein
MSTASSTSRDPKEQRAFVFPLAFWIVLIVAAVVGCIMMPFTMRPDPPRRPSIARPILHVIPGTPSTSRPVAPASPPAAVPVPVCESTRGGRRAPQALHPRSGSATRWVRRYFTLPSKYRAARATASTPTWWPSFRPAWSSGQMWMPPQMRDWPASSEAS